ncbi:MAG: type VI secretion system baseplate subunit TssG [Gammaproteobacteria bacterium]|nr:type VI secretion system baseplate subunit TssG [Gammaproteobacteria bacterium]
MSPQGWRKNTSIIRKLMESAYEYPFLQAVRLLERSAIKEKAEKQSGISVNPVARFVPPNTEVLRFSSFQSLAFPSSEVESLSRGNYNDNVDQWQMLINLIGLSGAMGVLPYHYTELILKREKQKDKNFEHFLNLFNHRTASLFFQASVKYRLPLQYERNALHRKNTAQHSAQTRALLSLIGMGNQSLWHRLYTRDESLLYFGGLFNQKIRSAGNLKQILQAHFKIPVEIQQFVGQWREMIDDVRSRLPDLEYPRGCNAVLGHSAMLGKRGWFAQGKIHIVLGPLNKEQLRKFEPGTDSLVALNELVRMYLGMEHDYSFIIRIRKRDIPEKVSLSGKSPPIIGWNTWLGSKAGLSDSPNETLDISVSASRLK